MSNEEKQLDDQESLSVYVERHRSGPLPPPDEFRQYEHILPGAADRILTLAESQFEHRASVQKMALWIGFIVAIGFLIGAVTLAFVATPVAAVLFAVVPTLVSGGAYVYGLRRRSQERLQLLAPREIDAKERLAHKSGEDRAD